MFHLTHIPLDTRVSESCSLSLRHVFYLSLVKAIIMFCVVVFFVGLAFYGGTRVFLFLVFFYFWFGCVAG